MACFHRSIYGDIQVSSFDAANVTADVIVHYSFLVTSTFRQNDTGPTEHIFISIEHHYTLSLHVCNMAVFSSTSQFLLKGFWLWSVTVRITWFMHFLQRLLDAYPKNTLISGRDRRLYSFKNIRQCTSTQTRMGEERGAYRVLVGKPEGKRPLGRPRRRKKRRVYTLFKIFGTYICWINI